MKNRSLTEKTVLLYYSKLRLYIDYCTHSCAFKLFKSIFNEPRPSVLHIIDFYTNLFFKHIILQTRSI